MDILIVAATHFEIKPLLDFLEINDVATGLHHSNKELKGNRVQVLITGVGMVNTAYMMGRYSNNLFDLILNVGVCGAFNKDLKLGDVVHVIKDTLSEMGAEDGTEFITYDKLNLGGTHIFENALAQNNYFEKINNLRQVSGITVNTIHGNDESIDKIKQRYPVDVESMEGASFFASCARVENFTQIRAISNYVEKRDKSKWNMSLAIKNLNDFLINFINN